MKIVHRTPTPRRGVFIILLTVLSLASLTVSLFATMHLMDKTTVITMPDLSNKSVESARSVLRVKRLKMTIQEYRFDQRVASNHILQQNPLPGEMTESGTIASVIVSRGLQNQAVPSLKGLTFSKAAQTLEAAGFHIGKTTFFFTNDAEKEIVLDHQPGPSEQAPFGANIHLLISQGSRPSWLIMPSLKGWQVDDAVNLIKYIGMQLQEIKRVATADYAPGIILDQTPHAGIRIKSEDPAGLVVNHQDSQIPFETRLITIEYLVPPLRKEVRIKFFVRDATGLHEVYNAMEKSSTKISIRRTVSGESATLFIYLNGKLQEERNI